MAEMGSTGRGEEPTGLGGLLAPEWAPLGHLPFVDNVACKVDQKTGRMTLPSHLRAAFADGHATMRPMKGGQVWMWTPLGYTRWQKGIARRRPDQMVSPRNRHRVFASAKDVAIDRQGRFVLGAWARDHVGAGSELVVAGCGDHIELWHPTAWADEEAQFDEWDLDVTTYQGLDLETGE